MKQLVILSGKGGTGKTTIASAFINLANSKAYADCDVDAPNLHLVTKQSGNFKTDKYFALDKAKIDYEICINCGICQKHCRYGAITNSQNKYYIDSFACEGCSVCEFVCPEKAISMIASAAGETMVTRENQVFSTAKLYMGSGTSGKLVTQVKSLLFDEIKSQNIKERVAIIDGSPGIGCPVIATLSGTDMTLIVTEPTISGISDMKRIVKTAQNFGVKIYVCINKYDVNLDNSQEIENYCCLKNLNFAGKIPYDKLAISAVNAGKSVIDIDCPSGRAIKKVFEKINLF